jgi:methionyl-tRNA formyltransferase
MVTELGLDIPVLQPTKLDEIYDQLRELGADVFVVAAYGKILRQELIDIAPHGVVGIHGSVLPKYRGAAPMQQALIDGVSETGISLFIVDAEVDHGPVIADGTIAVAENETYLTLEAKLAELGAVVTATRLPMWLTGGITAREQNHELATFTKKFSSADGYVAYEDLDKAINGDAQLARAINNKIRGLTPEPGVWTEYSGSRIKLLESHTEQSSLVVTKYQRSGKVAVTGKLKL